MKPVCEAHKEQMAASRGYVLRWLITEVPPELGPVPLTRRVIPMNLLILYLVAALSLAFAWGVITLVARLIRT